jgi:DNA-binding winged helix-turn-helix (wHTH) protein
MKLLAILLERPGEVVTREELRNRVWADESFGDFDQAVNIAIGKLRSALGDSADNPRFIETLPKRGYRFIPNVSVVDADARPRRPESADRDQPATECGHKLQGTGPTVAPAAPKRRLWSMRPVSVALPLVLGLSILAVWLFRSRGRAPTGSRSLGASAGPPLGSRPRPVMTAKPPLCAQLLWAEKIINNIAMQRETAQRRFRRTRFIHLRHPIEGPGSPQDTSRNNTKQLNNPKKEFAPPLMHA